MQFRHLVQIRDKLDSLPKTAATVKLADCLSGGATGLSVSDSDLMPLNTWQVPEDRVTANTSRGIKLVNPHYPHTHKYSPIYEKVQLTEVLTSGKPEHHRTAKDFTVIMNDARETFKKKRWEFIKKAAHHHYSMEQVAKRLDVYEPKYIYKICNNRDHSFSEMRKKGRRSVSTRWAELRDEGYTTREIGHVYGYPDSTVRDYSNKFAARKL